MKFLQKDVHVKNIKVAEASHKPHNVQNDDKIKHIVKDVFFPFSRSSKELSAGMKAVKR